MAERDVMLGQPQLSERTSARAASLTRCASRSFGTASRQCRSIGLGFGSARRRSWHTDLMLQRHVAAFARRAQDGEADFQCRHRPGAVMQGRTPLDNGRIEFVDDFGARHSGGGSASSRAAPF